MSEAAGADKHALETLLVKMMGNLARATAENAQLLKQVSGASRCRASARVRGRPPRWLSALPLPRRAAGTDFSRTVGAVDCPLDGREPALLHSFPPRLPLTAPWPLACAAIRHSSLLG
mgnify:CR=1 FL=1